MESFTIAQLVNKCKISKTTFYNCFSSKEDFIWHLNNLNDNGERYITSIKDRIVFKAMEMFSQYGYIETDLNSVADAAGVNKGSIYRYFINKEDLFNQCILYEIKKRKDFAHFVRETISDPMEILAKYAEYNCEHLHSPQAKLFLLSRALSYQNENIKKCFDEYIQYRVNFITEVIEDGKKQGIFRQDIDSVVIAKIFVAFFNNISFAPVIDITTIKKEVLFAIHGLIKNN